MKSLRHFALFVALVAAFPLPAADNLDAAKQKTIWDAEHVTFEIETYFGLRQ